ncbi:PEP-CTERM sorting domain-containing protein [Alteromonas sp. CYL-A6]|uniref:PEP-CTERM sorting domain-containing protein n=1 Tax=Alteromonas nitratireducens TaxID=3390813 RepID=UPI0034BAFD43
MKFMKLIKLVAASALFVGSANAALITVADGDHNINDGAYGIPSITSLGHSIEYMGTNQSSIFAGSADIVIIEQNPYFASFDMSLVNSFLAGGGHIIQFGGSAGARNLFDQIYGTNFGYGTFSFDTTMAPSGSSYFDSFAPTKGGLLDEESSTHGYNTASLLSSWGGTSVFNGGGITSVWTGQHNGGLLTYLGYDYCCAASSPDTREQWVEVLNFSINNGAVIERDVPAPSTIALFALALLTVRRFRKA